MCQELLFWTTLCCACLVTSGRPAGPGSRTITSVSPQMPQQHLRLHQHMSHLHVSQEAAPPPACEQALLESPAYHSGRSSNALQHFGPDIKDVLAKGTLPYRFAQQPDGMRDVEHCIPKRIHFLWTGAVLPIKYAVYLASFVDSLEPSYEIWMWADQHVPTAERVPGVSYKDVTTVAFANQDILETVTAHAERADIMRYELVYLFGGIWLDIDNVCQKPFDELLAVSFVSHTFEPYNNLQNSMFGFPAGSNFLRFVIACVRENYEVHHAANDGFLPNRAGPPFFTTCFWQFGDPAVLMIDQQLLMAEAGKSYVHHRLDYTWAH